MRNDYVCMHVCMYVWVLFTIHDQVPVLSSLIANRPQACQLILSPSPGASGERGADSGAAMGVSQTSLAVPCCCV